MTSGSLLNRRALALTTEHLANARVVVVNGARQSGKSELLRMVTVNSAADTSRSTCQPTCVWPGPTRAGSWPCPTGR